MNNNEFLKHIDFSPIREVKHLYHGSKNGIPGRIVPNYKLARRAIDFGQGFYLGNNPTQAKALICGRDDYHPVLYKADIDLNGLNCVRVSGLPWAFLIAYNRGFLDEYEDTALYTQIAGIGNGQDIIAGPSSGCNAISGDGLNIPIPVCPIAASNISNASFASKRLSILSSLERCFSLQRFL